MDLRLKAKADLDARKKEIEQKRETLKTEIEKRKTEFKTEINNKKEEIKSEVEKRKEGAISQIKERLAKFTSNTVERFNAAIDRLEKLAQRIDSRIGKLEAEGVNVSKAKELMVIAKLKIETAKTSVSGISLQSELTASSTATSTAMIKKDFDGLRAQLDKAKTDIKAAHAALVDVVNNLKPGRNKTATSTATTTENETN
jgi:ABC-type transporter Mla subunit MlaD